jgi:hypothetical protein
MLATGALAAPKKAPPPPPPPPPAPAPAPAAAPQFIGSDAGSFTFSGADDATFYVTLGPGTYVITGTVDGIPDSKGGYNVTRATLENSIVNDAFEKPGRNQFSENPYTYTVTSPTRLSVDVFTNYNGNHNVGTFNGTLTVREESVATVVPEPATGALLLAGVGLIAFSARRRRI